LMEHMLRENDNSELLITKTLSNILRVPFPKNMETQTRKLCIYKEGMDLRMLHDIFNFHQMKGRS
jgi:hypothetical protein